ncbi:hypothetical protein [Cellulophaga sp. 3_MG-2023]|uniref:hypothetical protein n=1 Tax=Cellulophaga sp. 3_MG-2023 TaxID=3062675 RepID=UPI0026E15703|nr:hypothetical protein [Cellulophaga sp. 3_MG-2023]
MPNITLYIILFFYALTLAIALWRYPKYYNTALKYYPILIAYTLASEAIGIAIRIYPDSIMLPISKFYQNYNRPIYNVFNIIFFLYFFNLYKNYTDSLALKKYIKIGSSLFIAISISNIFTQDFLTDGQILTYVTGGFLLILIILNYLNKIDWLQNKKDPIKNILYWLSWGLLIFYSGYLPLKLSYHFKIIKTMDSYIITRWLHFSLIIIMYLCFIYGFIKMKRKLVKE